ncbi:MAG: acyltransferase [Flavobacteriales bacterium]|jgi:acetyltransferase-like isoleucine patch superfamily enzyme|nr:acyltransferase [Flavobacteriales bacterium]
MIILKPITFFIKLLTSKRFTQREMNDKTMVIQFIHQKILRFNGKVPWPVHRTSKIKGIKLIEPGTRCPGLSPGCYIDGRNGIKIGDNTWIGPQVCLISMNHNTSDYYGYIEGDPIIIGENCWIGAGAKILPQVEIGNHVVVAAGAVVTKSFKEDNILLAGIPAEIVKNLNAYSE